MLKNKYIKIATVSFSLLIALWVATPKVYLNDILNPFTTNVSIDTEAKVKSQSSSESTIEKPSSYFNVFKFVFSFIPSKGK